jgi:predicted small lipoprotein YifL
MQTLGLLMLLGLVTGCGTKHPVLYPDSHLAAADRTRSAADVAECEALAEDYVSSGNAARDAAAGGGTGAAVGAATGAAAGAAWGGRAGRGAAAGAAGGATAGVLGSLLRRREPDPVYKNYVTRCLADRGYHVIGWK